MNIPSALKYLLYTYAFSISVAQISHELQSRSTVFNNKYIFLSEFFHEKFAFIIRNRYAKSLEREPVYFILTHSNYHSRREFFNLALWSTLNGLPNERYWSIRFIESICNEENVLYLLPTLFDDESIIVECSAKVISRYPSKLSFFIFQVGIFCNSLFIKRRRVVELLNIHRCRASLFNFFPIAVPKS